MSSVLKTFFQACADRGLVRDGLPNLGLFRRLFWLLVTSFLLVGQTIFPINALVLGTFPEEGIAGRICLLRDSTEKVDEVEGVRERKLLFVAFGFLDIFVLCYFSSRVKRFLRRLCPNGRMSCIGFYKRNVINFSQTLYLIFINVLFIVFGLAVILFIQENRYELSKKSIFWIWNINSIVFSEGFHFFCFPFLLKLSPERHIPQKPATQFYVRNPIIEPLRPKKMFKYNSRARPQNYTNYTNESCSKRFPIIQYCRSHQTIFIKTSTEVKMYDLKNRNKSSLYIYTFSAKLS